MLLSKNCYYGNGIQIDGSSQEVYNKFFNSK